MTGRSAASAACAAAMTSAGDGVSGWVALFNVRDGAGEVVRALVAAGADPDAENNYGASPRSLASTVANYDLMRFFRG